MNELQIFNFNSSQVRTMLINEKIWFVGKDVSEILGYSDLDKAVRHHVDIEDKETLMYKASAKIAPSLWSGNDYSNKTLINESGMYSLVFGSTLPNAKQFKRWVTSDVLPSIRKTGFYQLPTEPEDIMIETLKTQKEIKANLKLVQNDIFDLKQEINLSRSQKHRLAGLVRKNVFNSLGGKRMQAYKDKNLKARLYSQHWREIKNYFDVEAYEEIPKVKYNEAIQFAEMWEPSTELKMLIVDKNSQIPLEI